MKCPDGKLLSACADGEVPSPWKERIEQHALSCPDCARSLGSYKALSERLAHDALSGENTALEAARSRIAASLGLASTVVRASFPAPAAATVKLLPEKRVKREAPAYGPLWPRRFHIPMPLAAAALALVLFSVGLVVGRLGVKSNGQNIAATQKILASQAGTIEDLVKYLDTQSSSQAVTIRLPSEASFSMPGDPILMTTSSGAVATSTTLSASGGSR